MEFSQVLARRRMVRNYTTQPVEEAAVHRVAAAALRGPTAGNTQAIGVVVITDDATRARIAHLADEPAYTAKGFDPWISRAPVHIVISVSEEVYLDRYSEPDKLGPSGEIMQWPVPYWWVDAGASLMAVLLAAVDEGLGAGFLGVHSIPDLSELLKLPSDYKPIGVVTLGHPAPDRRSSSLDRPRKTADEAIHRDRWPA